MTKFAKQTSFYETKFKKMPNFSPGNFGDVVYFNTAKWEHGFEFEDIKNSICTAYNAQGIEKDKKRKDQLAENIINFRDSCRAIKNALIKENNLLDAQNFHRAELYCKEIELREKINNDEYKRIKGNSVIQNDIKHRTELWFLRITLVFYISMFISCILGLYFFYYNDICETFIKSIVINTVVYAFLVYFAVKYFNISHDKIKDIFNKLKLPNLSLWWDWILLSFYRYTSDHHTNIDKILHIAFIMVTSYGLTMLPLYFCATNSYMKLLILLSLFAISFWLIKTILTVDDYLDRLNIKILYNITQILIIASILDIYIGKIMIFILYYIFFMFILWMFYSVKNNLLIILSKTISYIGVIAVLIFAPYILNPILGIGKKDELKNIKLNKSIDVNYDSLEKIAIAVIDKNYTIENIRTLIIENKNIIKNKEISENYKEVNSSLNAIKEAIKEDEIIDSTRQSINVIYMILLILSLYSLQKTARKNSIVPS